MRRRRMIVGCHRLDAGRVLEDHRELAPIGLELGLAEIEPGEARHMGDVDVDGHGASLDGGRIGQMPPAPSVAGMDSQHTGHIAPVVIVPHRVGPDGWSAAAHTLAAALRAGPHLELTLRLPGAAVDHLVTAEPEAWQVLASHDLAWLAGGWSDPVLADLPLLAARRQLDREKLTLDAAGITPVGLWLDDGWDRTIPTLARDSGFRLVLVDAAVVDAGRPGAVDRAGDTVVMVPVATRPRESVDGLSAVRLAPSDLEAFCQAHPGRLITPDRYLVDHLPGDPLEPRVMVPSRSPETEAFYRKLLRVIADHAQTAAYDAVLQLESREFTTGGEESDADVRLLETRRGLDRARNRGDSWVKLTEVDWDADGNLDLQVETYATSLVLDPAHGQILVWDDRIGGWPITSVAGSGPGVIARSLGTDGTEAVPSRMWIDSRTEGPAEVRVRLSDEAGGRYRVIAAGRRLTVEATPVATPGARLGPELPVRLDPAETRLRVDGGEWSELDGMQAVMGHRFRLTDGAHTMLISSSRPATVFIDLVAEAGVVLWPHWAVASGAEYRVSFEPV